MPAPTTLTALLGGELRLRQPATGYRVNVDALLLAAFAAGRSRAKLTVDLGAGVGAIGLALHHVGATLALALVERESELAELARVNLAHAGAPGAVHEMDLERGLPRPLVQSAELVVCNPPFFPANAGQRQGHPLARAARSGSLAPFVAAAARALCGPRGRAVFAYPTRSLPELLALATAARLVAKRLRLVHAQKDEPARLALLEVRKAKPGGLVVEPPLVEWTAKGTRSPELAAIVAGEFGPRKRG